MKVWEKGIKEFDRDLKKRMMIISGYERTGFNLDSLLDLIIRKALGFVIYGEFPRWRDSEREWRIRNAERVNDSKRIWRIRNPSLFKAQCERYRKNHIQEIKLRSSRWFKGLSVEKRIEGNNRRRLRRARVKEKLRQSKGVRSTSVLLPAPSDGGGKSNESLFF